ncbi:hypothetical protein [Rhodoplanes roseus]|uniref:hypothetical protein n=1 Tax=Rhodoplanes roseus TaxID=29409 RepID=UPI0011B85088|nr:hypothetical protein [Rhodoplanes roseus]
MFSLLDQILGDDRQREAEHGPTAEVRFRLNAPLVSLKDVAAHRQVDVHALDLGRCKRHEQPVGDRWRKPGSGIGDAPPACVTARKSMSRRGLVSIASIALRTKMKTTCWTWTL